MSRPLWQLLIDFSDRDIPNLTCEECFAILDYYAGQLADGADPEEMRGSVVDHMSRCPECHPKFSQWLEQLE